MEEKTAGTRREGVRSNKKIVAKFLLSLFIPKTHNAQFVANVDLIDDCSKIIMFFDLSEEKSVPMFTQFA